MMLADADPFSAGVFTDMWWGSKLLDDSRRNGFTWDVGARGVADRALARHDHRPRSTSTSGAIVTARS